MLRSLDTILPKHYKNFFCSLHISCISTYHTKLKTFVLKRIITFVFSMYFIKSTISPLYNQAQSSHFMKIICHFIWLCMSVSNTVVQTQGKRLACQARQQHIPNFSLNTVFINLTDVKFYSFFFLKIKTMGDKEYYIFLSQVLAASLEILQTWSRVNCVQLQQIMNTNSSAKWV